MDPFSLPNNAQLKVTTAGPQPNLSVRPLPPAPSVSVQPLPPQPQISVAPPDPLPQISIEQPNFGTFDFPQLDYGNVNYFIADGSQIDASTGKPYDINTPVFEAPDFMVNSQEFKEKIEPLITAPIEGFDDFGKPIHIMNTQEFKEAIDDFVQRQKSYQATKANLSEQYRFDDAAGEAFISAFNNYKQTGNVDLPNGNSVNVKEFENIIKDMNDVSIGALAQEYINAINNIDLDAETRGKALAVLEVMNEKKLLQGSGGSKAGYFAGTAGAELIRGAYSLVDTLTPDSLARVAKFDESQLAKNMENIQNDLSNLDGYSAVFRAGEIAGIGIDIAASMATGRAFSVPTRLALATTARAGGETLKRIGDRAAFAGALSDDVVLLERAGDAMSDAGRILDKTADWFDTSVIARQVARTPAESLTFDALNNENDTFGQNWLRNALMFTAADASLLGLVKTYQAAVANSRRVTAEGMSVQKFDELNEAIFQDGDDALKFITTPTAGTRSILKPVAQIDDRSEEILASNNSLKALMESATTGLVDRFKAITPEQSGELIVKGHIPGEVKKILGDELGEAYIGIRKTLHKHLNRIGLKVNNIDEYIFRSGVKDKRVAGKTPSSINTTAVAEGERVIDTGGELLFREGYLDDVGIGNTIRNYVRSNMGAAINRLTAARLIQSGAVIREAAPGSTLYRAARNNGGILKISRNVDGRELDTGYVATKDWLSDPDNGMYQQIDSGHRMVGDALNTVKKNSKNFKGNFYATTDTLTKLNNYATRNIGELREGMLPAAARLFERGQDLVLAGGIPFTPVNAFGVAQMLAAMAADPLRIHKYGEAFARAVAGKAKTREFYLSRMYNDDPQKFSIVDAQRYGVNLIPRKLLSEASEPTGIQVGQASQVDQVQFLTLKDEISEIKNTVLPKLQRNINSKKEKLDEATEKLAQSEMRSSGATTATLNRRKNAVAKLEKEHSAATKELEEIRTSLTQKEADLAALEEGFQEGNVAFDILDATGNKLTNTMKDLGVLYDKTIADATFERLMPMLQVLTTESIVNRALARGMTKMDAYAEGSKSLKRFWNIGPEGAYGSVADSIGVKSNERRQMLSDIATILITAPKYRAAVINRVWNTLKAADPRKFTSLEYRLNVRWAMTMMTFFLAWQIANKAINGRYTWENPTGSFDELQIPMGDGGDILRLSLFGTQLSFPRAIGRSVLASVRGEGQEAANEMLSMGSVLGQPLARSALNVDWRGEPVSESSAASVQGIIDRGKFIIENYLGHPFIKGSQQAEEGNWLRAVLTAIESPIRTGNMEISAKGEFYNEVVDEISAISNEYAGQIKAAYDDEAKKATLMQEMFREHKSVLDRWASKYGKNVADLPDDMSRALLKAIVDTRTPISLGGFDTLEGSQQVNAGQAEQRVARNMAQEAGFDLYSWDDRTDEIRDIEYGAPKRLAYEFEQLFKADKENGIESMYDIRKRMYDELEPLYEEARGLKGAAATAIYDQINARQEQYLEVLAERLRPLIDKYGVNILANNKKVLDEVAEYVVVPGDFTPFLSRKKQPYATRDAAAFIKDYFGVGNLNPQNLPTDQEVLDGIRRANADMNAGRTQAATYRLTELQQDITAGEVFADPEAMSTIRDMIKKANSWY